MSIDKRANEWSILRNVYDVAEFEEIVESERPDFLLRRAGSDVFGVEVTELFATGADARAANHPEYLAELFEGGRYMHRADRELLPVVRVRVTDSDGAVKHEDLPAVFTPTAPEDEHRTRIAEVIHGKADRGYALSGTHINLVIRDRFLLTGEVLEDEYSVTELLSSGIREALLDSPFHEVYLVSVRRTGEQVVRSLQQLMLAEQFFIFGKAAEATLGRPDFGEQWKYVQAFADFSERRGMPVVLRDYQGYPVAARRSAAVGLGEGWDLELLDLADHFDLGFPEWKKREGFMALTNEEIERCAAFVEVREFRWGIYGRAPEQAEISFPHTRTVFLTEVTEHVPPTPSEQ